MSSLLLRQYMTDQQMLYERCSAFLPLKWIWITFLILFSISFSVRPVLFSSLHFILILLLHQFHEFKVSLVLGYHSLIVSKRVWALSRRLIVSITRQELLHHPNERFKYILNNAGDNLNSFVTRKLFDAVFPILNWTFYIMI